MKLISEKMTRRDLAEKLALGGGKPDKTNQSHEEIRATDRNAGLHRPVAWRETEAAFSTYGNQ